MLQNLDVYVFCQPLPLTVTELGRVWVLSEGFSEHTGMAKLLSDSPPHALPLVSTRIPCDPLEARVRCETRTDHPSQTVKARSIDMDIEHDGMLTGEFTI